MRAIGEPATALPLTAWVAVLSMAMSMGTDAAPAESMPPRDVTLLVIGSGQYMLAGSPVASEDLRARLHALKASGESINLHVRAGPKAEYKFISEAVRIAQEEGLSKLGILMAPSSPGSSASASSR